MKPSPGLPSTTLKGLRNAGPWPQHVAILDLYDDLATIKVTSVPYVEYLHVARFGESWLIVNVLWQRRAESAADR